MESSWPACIRIAKGRLCYTKGERGKHSPQLTATLLIHEGVPMNRSSLSLRYSGFATVKWLVATSSAQGLLLVILQLMSTS
ncbi:hypothetical protein BJX65DRAFT_280786 [Aspergillus insuetus]